MVRVLIVDDSAVVRRVIEQQLSQDPEIEVVGQAPDPYVARDMILKLKPDVLTLDLEMPRMDGLTFLKKLMQFYPLPVIILSSLAKKGSRIALEALRIGAVDVFCKPGSASEIGEVSTVLARQIKAAAAARVGGARQAMQSPRAALQHTFSYPPNRIIAIGASTGGTRAIEAVLRDFPANAPATLLIQHMPPNFTKPFAESLNKACAIEVKEASHGDALAPGLALLAPGDSHMVLARGGAGHRVEMTKGPRVHFQRPAVDVTFCSVAQIAGPDAVGVLLTGMGTDGAKGLLEMRRAGARTIAQDQATSVVYGMPKAAADIAAAEKILPLQDIAHATLGFSSVSRGAA
ncbi:MAG: chemotaxis response regulator protein-glutamate methylesterase [Candidatus Eisenbacteria sp.]|nr:chemotaxis response regulator protein-glutamate methylesterase [Candidatus Eisenbacteria bacterium]